MNTTLSKRPLRVPQTVFDAFEERAVDMDILLPDYIPEVSAILKCSLRPIVTSRMQSGDRYAVDGVVGVRIMYVAEDRQTVHCYEATQPFHVGFMCETAIHHLVTLKTDYVNCRAVAPRRIDVHGAFRVFLKAIGVGEVSIFTPPAERDVFCRTKTVMGSLPVCEAEKSFVVEERIDLGMSIDRLICADTVVLSSELKQLVNKAIVKGVMRLSLLYAHDESVETLSQEVPFSQIMDVDGMCEDWQCRMHIAVGECDMHLNTTENGVSYVTMNTKLTACLLCHTLREEEVVLDAYSVSNPLLCETSPVHFVVNTPARTDRTTFYSQTDLPENVVDVVDLWGELKSCELTHGDQGDMVALCVSVGMIGRDSDGSLAYYERTVDVTSPYNGNATALTGCLLGVEHNISGRALRMQIEAEIASSGNTVETESVVCDAVEEHNNPYKRTGAAIRIVYANAGDSVWDIAKTHHACMQDILAENDLSETVIAVPTMLMIPMM